MLLRWGGRDPNPESSGSVRARGGRGDEVVAVGRWAGSGGWVGGQGRVGWGAWVGGVRVARQRVRAGARAWDSLAWGVMMMCGAKGRQQARGEQWRRARAGGGVHGRAAAAAAAAARSSLTVCVRAWWCVCAVGFVVVGGGAVFVLLLLLRLGLAWRARRRVVAVGRRGRRRPRHGACGLVRGARCGCVVGGFFVRRLRWVMVGHGQSIIDFAKNQRLASVPVLEAWVY